MFQGHLLIKWLGQVPNLSIPWLLSSSAYRLILRMKCRAWCLTGTQQCWFPPPPPSREKYDWKSLGREAAAEKGKKVAWLERAASNSDCLGTPLSSMAAFPSKLFSSVSLRLKISRTFNNSCGVLVFFCFDFVFFFCTEHTVSISHCYW